MSTKNILGRLLMVVVATSAFATFANAETCTTQSHNISFISTPGEVDASTSAVLSACQTNSVTNNTECANNLSCGFSVANPYPSGRASCQTSNNNLGFQASGDEMTIDALVTAILTDCSHAPGSSNNCATNVTCSDLSQVAPTYPSAQVMCTTTSHSINFVQSGTSDSVSTVANAVVSECQNNSVTNNTDCTNNLVCSDGANAPSQNDMVACHTTSHNIPFVNRGPRSQIDQTVSQLLNTCTTNAVAVNTECSANLSCD